MITWDHVIKGIALDLVAARPEWPRSLVERFLRERRSDGATVTTLIDLATELADRTDLHQPVIILSHVPKARTPETPRVNRREPLRCGLCGHVVTVDGECAPDCLGES